MTNASGCPTCDEGEVCAECCHSTTAVNAPWPAVTFDELRRTVAQLEALRPPSLTEGQMMRLVSMAYEMGRMDEKRMTLRRVAEEATPRIERAEADRILLRIAARLRREAEGGK